MQFVVIMLHLINFYIPNKSLSYDCCGFRQKEIKTSMSSVGIIRSTVMGRRKEKEKKLMNGRMESVDYSVSKKGRAAVAARFKTETGKMGKRNEEYVG